MKKTNIYIALGIFTSSLLFQSHLLQAQTEPVATEPAQPSSLVKVDQLLPAPIATQEITDEVSKKAIQRMQFLERIKDQIRTSKSDLSDVKKTTDEATEKLLDSQIKVQTLADQIRNLDEQLVNTESMITNVEWQITEKEREITVLMNDIEEKEIEIEQQKKLLMEYLMALYEQENSVKDTFDEEQQMNVVKLLMSDVSVGDQLQQLKYFNVLESVGHEVFETLETLVASLEEDQQKVEASRAKLELLKTQLVTEKENYRVQKEGKSYLLEQTKGEEKIYEKLLDESKKQQDQIEQDIQVLQDNLVFLQKKMTELGDDFDIATYSKMLAPEVTSVYLYMKQTANETEGLQFRWPVSPSRGITAYFHDDSYRRAMGMQHNAIDIRETQGTAIKAPADGVVYKVKDNGYGYSYLIIAHSGGLMTVYGHVSEFKVVPGQKVYQGQTVALTGGTPGSKGAGLMTTGAHLHFEVLKGGKYVDPLDYLPLTSLALDSLPEKYKNRVTGEAAKVKRTAPNEETIGNDADLRKNVESGGAHQLAPVVTPEAATAST